MKQSLRRYAFLGFLTAVSLLLAACNTQTEPQPTPTTAIAAQAETAVPTLTPEPTATATTPPPPNCDPFPTVASDPPTIVPTYSYEVINSYPHDENAFTQGLVYVDGILYESTGIKRTPSSLRRVDLATGEVQQTLDIGSEYFGEGLVLWQDWLIQLTWQNRVAFVYDRESFDLLQTWQYDTEGWGITHNGRCLIMSDGSSTLYFRDPVNFVEMGRITVQDQNGPVTLLNELEYVDGEVWANVWQTNRIVRINPANGQVIGNIDLTGLLDPTTSTQPPDVLNGIAYDAANGRVFVTGKLWPTLFEIELVPQEEN